MNAGGDTLYPYMEIILPVFLLAIGLAILIFGAEWLVRGASSVASGFGISPLVVGLTIVAFGTSAPELTVNIYSVLTGSTDLAVGNIIGSTTANILLILGVSAIIMPLAVKSSTVRWEIPLMTLAAILVFVSGNDRLFDGEAVDVFTRTDGIALLGFFIIFLFYIRALIANDPPPLDETLTKPLRPSVSLALVFSGLTGLVLGGKLLVDNAVILAELAGLSQAVIGLTVVAIGTSLPELATSIVAAFKKEVDIAVGNIVGSNIFNLFWILGVSSVIAPLPSPEGFLFDASIALAASVILFLALFVGTKRQIDRLQGWLFLGIYIFYIGYLVM